MLALSVRLRAKRECVNDSLLAAALTHDDRTGFA
jgi:hypothetical protein